MGVVASEAFRKAMVIFSNRARGQARQRSLAGKLNQG